MPKVKATFRKHEIGRGEIWWVSLEPTIGNETGKERPCLILQNDLGNKNSETTVVAPFLPGHKTYPFVVNVVPTEKNRLKGKRHLNLSQIRAIDIRRIKNRQGVLEDIYWPSIESAVCIELGFGEVFER